MRFFEKPKSIDTASFGQVLTPIQVNQEKGCLETYVSYGIKDLSNIVHSAYWYYSMKADQTNRQEEIAELFYKLHKLLNKEKSVVGRITSPIIIPNPGGENSNNT